MHVVIDKPCCENYREGIVVVYMLQSSVKNNAWILLTLLTNTNEDFNVES